jgi:hypothetical protein
MIANTSTPVKADAGPVPDNAVIFTGLIPPCVNISNPDTIAFLKDFSGKNNCPFRGYCKVIFYSLLEKDVL